MSTLVCAMCWLERDETRMRPVMQNLPVKVCGKCSMDLDRAKGFFEFIGVRLQIDLGADDVELQAFADTVAKGLAESETPPNPPKNGRKQPSEVPEGAGTPAKE